ncbi:hypothetical protein GCM10007103_15940 [Salinimicrobium marinum]|uniref:Uncharacterized protein n=1 Tax=Salinimicrobium marinum TaxID=680283 RepID=A0A918SD14_9FLAO|nr:hypothetical protein [Salinimicrobium marinum]GHA35202.1 hypothetical protein GCM10007103_15940 [Salinimicrobium marinum]
MKFLKICLVALPVLLLSGNLKAQEHLDPNSYNGDLISYLTEVNLWMENQMLLNSCRCAENEDFLTEYQNVRSAYNSWINSQLMHLGLLKPRKAVNAFEDMKRNGRMKVTPELFEAHRALERFYGFGVSSCREQSIIPGIVTVAELVSVANTVVGILSETQKRREAQKLLIIQTLEDFKLPPVSDYKCSEK